MQSIKNYIQSEEGQGLTEYALIIGLVILAGIMGVTLLGNTTSRMYQDIIQKVTAV